MQGFLVGELTDEFGEVLEAPRRAESLL